MKRHRPQRFATHYLTAAGVLMVLADEFVTLIRLSDGHCRTVAYGEIGMAGL